MADLVERFVYADLYMRKIVLLFTLTFFVAPIGATEPALPPGDCEAVLQANLEIALKKYRSLLYRSQQTSVNSGANIAQKIILSSLQRELRGYGWTDQQIAAIEPEHVELPPALPASEPTPSAQAIKTMIQSSSHIDVPRSHPAYAFFSQYSNRWDGFQIVLSYGMVEVYGGKATDTMRNIRRIRADELPDVAVDFIKDLGAGHLDQFIQSPVKYRMQFYKNKLNAIHFSNGSQIEVVQFVRAYLAHAPFNASVPFPRASAARVEQNFEEDGTLLVHANGSTFEVKTQSEQFADFMDGLVQGYESIPFENVHIRWGPYAVDFARKGNPNRETIFRYNGKAMTIHGDPIGYKISADQKTIYVQRDSDRIFVVTAEYLETLNEPRGVGMFDPF